MICLIWFEILPLNILFRIILNATVSEVTDLSNDPVILIVPSLVYRLVVHRKEYSLQMPDSEHFFMVGIDFGLLRKHWIHILDGRDPVSTSSFSPL